jgi:hypothetical protein
MPVLPQLPQVASSWAAVGEAGASGWCYLQLRKHLPAISAAGRDECMGLALQQRLQALQFGVLQGSLCMAARQGHQVGCFQLVLKTIQTLVEVSIAQCCKQRELEYKSVVLWLARVEMGQPLVQQAGMSAWGWRCSSGCRRCSLACCRAASAWRHGRDTRWVAFCVYGGSVKSQNLG